jgi:hydroxymethylpyrimidine pyrophosphatase-like HAD family hydrolase
MLNIEKEKVVAVGDSGNDIPMMSGAGISVAVSNATDTLKAVCDRVICSNNEHVVEYILKNF